MFTYTFRQASPAGRRQKCPKDFRAPRSPVCAHDFTNDTVMTSSRGPRARCTSERSGSQLLLRTSAWGKQSWMDVGNSRVDDFLHYESEHSSKQLESVEEPDGALSAPVNRESWSDPAHRYIPATVWFEVPCGTPRARRLGRLMTILHISIHSLYLQGVSSNTRR